MDRLREVVELLRAELTAQGVSLENFDQKITAETVEQVLCLHLSNSCVVMKNKRSGGHQTHIHITGKGMTMFFPIEEIKTIEETGQNIEIPVILFKENLLALNRRNFANGEQVMKLDLDRAPSVIRSMTYKKLVRRGNGSHQVQLSRITFDDMGFIRLRSNLFEGDKIIFVKCVGEEALYAVGVPLQQAWQAAAIELCTRPEEEESATGTASAPAPAHG